MLKQNIGGRVFSIAIVTIVLLAGATVFLSGNAKAWDAQVSVSPTQVHAGSDVNFEIQITNIGSEAMEITDVWIHFDWMEKDTYYYSHEVSDDNPYILGSGDTATFSISVPIPEGITTHTDHTFDIVIYAADPGFISEWGDSYPQTYSGSVFVEAPSSSGSGSSSGNVNGADALIGALVIIAIVALIIVAIVAISSKSKRNRYQQPPQPPYLIGRNQGMPPSTKICPYCGREIPADAKICPYCGYDFTKVGKK